MAGVAIALILAVGGFVFYNTNILNEYRGRGEAGLPQVEYERRYKQFEHTPQPVITDADLRVEIYPDAPAVDMRGSYQLVNRTGVADRLGARRDRQGRRHTIDRRSTARRRPSGRSTTRPDIGSSRSSSALAAGRLAAALVRRGVPAARVSRHERRSRPTSSATAATSTAGCCRSSAISRCSRCRRRGAEAFRSRAAAADAAADDAEARRRDEVVRNEDGVHVEMIVGTAADQIAVVAAPLRRSWTENGRRYFHYGSDAPGQVRRARSSRRNTRWPRIGGVMSALQSLPSPGASGRTRAG